MGSSASRPAPLFFFSMKHKKKQVLKAIVDGFKDGQFDVSFSFQGRMDAPTIIVIVEPQFSGNIAQAILEERERVNASLRKYVEEMPTKSKGSTPLRNVYLMRNNATGKHKIGRSKTPKYRENTLQSQEPDVELLFSCHESIISEKRLHEMYAHKRIRGEWFDLDKKDISNIRKLMQA